ncbi:SMP-30/gluconolactonase/LRE family protein [Rugamonas sp. FT82W]|uniref:SMP-30/gluconolactonase/LRE family protein n=1 Tax=Duganella vulcania TaxID=2692166 RepID=A0A845G3M3_9BURK|nr:SMP-30/gluconolactonase/LRE family protein [Duganella vulcania]MYM88230.1 SMP-30/gluconolactonase/LRE family protein [Duganella vulcania]
MERVSDIRCTVGESPTWSRAESAWYWVDIPAKRVWRLDGASGAARFWTTTEMAACVAAKAGGGLIAGMETGIYSLELGEAEAAAQVKLATPAAGLGEGMRFNDGRCDRQGRFWSGTMFMDMSAARAVGELYRYDAARGISAPMVSELITQNGLAFSPDGRTMYLSDSHPARRMVWAFDYDIDDGVPTGRRVFADMSEYAGRPDGAAIDSDGCYWICGNDGGYVLRFTPEGKLDRRIDVPMLKPAMCAFGGKDLDTLMVTSIVSGKPEDAEWGGAVVLLRPGVQGVAETPFGL